MRRTRWPQLSFNKYPSLNIPYQYIQSISPVRVHDVRNHIDRIQISIRNSDKSYGYLRDLFDAEFGVGKAIRDKGNKHRRMRSYQFKGIHFQLIHYTKIQYYFAATINDPTAEFMNKLRKMLSSLPHTKIYVSQIEFAWDFYVRDEREANLLKRDIGKKIILKYSRMNCFCFYKGTIYIGKEGNVREGSKGVRVYTKLEENKHFVRVELQVNRDFIRDKLGVCINSLPIDESYMTFEHLIEFRQTFTVEKAESLTARILNDNWFKVDGLGCKLKMKHKARMAAVTSRIDGIYDREYASDQISEFKKFKRGLKRRFGFTNQVEQYFPKI